MDVCGLLAAGDMFSTCSLYKVIDPCSRRVLLWQFRGRGSGPGLLVVVYVRVG